MEFYVMAKSYNCYGGHTTLSSIGSFLLLGADDFGGAIKELTVTLYFRDSGPPKKTLEHLLEMHNSYRSKLPKITYRKAKRKLEIDVASELMDGRDWKPSPLPSLSLFRLGVDEICSALSLMQKRIKSTDDFDLNAFLCHCNTAQQRIPASEQELQGVFTELAAVEKAKRDVKSPWEKIDVDWEDFHPKAREILDDLFFWEATNDFSPNGNDTGADLLQAYRRWLRKTKGTQPILFADQLAKQWGYSAIDAIDEDTRAEAFIGLAFSDIKLRGTCDEDVRRLAIDSLQFQRTKAKASTEWPHRDERLETLKKIESKLLRTFG